MNKMPWEGNMHPYSRYFIGPRTFTQYAGGAFGWAFLGYCLAILQLLLRGEIQ